MEIITKFYRRLASDSLYSNSIYLMLSTGIMATLGFFFWIINARLYSTDQVGIATTLISVMTLISTLSLLGLGNGLIKYFPTSNQKNEKINTVFTVSALSATVISIIFLIFLQVLSPKLSFLRENPKLSMLFVLFVVFASLNLMSESVFIALRSAKYVLIKNTIWSIAKLASPFLLVSLGAYGIFTSVGIAMVIAFALSALYLISKFKILIKLEVNRKILKKITKFSLGNYTVVTLGTLPALVLPIIVTNILGANYSAYFYIDMMIANFLFIIPLATSQSLFAEGSYNEKSLGQQLRKAITVISATLIPAVVVTLTFGKYILQIFGNDYTKQGISLLQILALSSVFLSVNYIGNSIFFIKHKIKQIILLNLIGTTSILALSIILSRYNLLGLGIAWIIGQSGIAITYLYLLKDLLKDFFGYQFKRQLVFLKH